MNSSHLDLLDVLRCVQCGHSELDASVERLVCKSCNASFDVRPPGIPFLITDDSLRRNSIHEQQWDNLPQVDYEQICLENRSVWEAIDGLVMKYCRGLVLEVCCGNARFLDVLNVGYWPGFWGTRIGYDTIFICQRVK